MALVVVSAATCTSGGSARTSASTTGSTTVPTASVPATSTTALAAPTSISSDLGWIAYQATAGLSLVRPDGTDAHTLMSKTASNPHHPDWAPDGTRLAYTTDEADGSSDIWIVDRDGANQRRLVDCQAPCVYADDPAWSPDGRRIAYWTNDDDADTSTQVIRIADAITGAVAVEIPAADLEGPVGPRWSPDGGQLVVEVSRYVAEGVGFTEGSSVIGVVDLSVSEPRIRVITRPDLFFPGYPDWSPASDRILFEAGNRDIDAHIGTPPNLFTIHPDGTELTQITHRGPDEPWVWMPTWTTLDSHPILVTLSDEVRLTLARLSDDGTDLVDLVDRDGSPVLGAHGRIAVSRTSPTSVPTASAPEDVLHLVVIGDSIPFSDFCAGCVGFVDRFAQELRATTGTTMDVANRSRNDSAQLNDIEQQVATDASLRAQISDADIVIVSVGFNDQAPWPADRPCSAEQDDTLEGQVAAIVKFTDSCITETIASYQEDYDAIFSGISELAQDGSVLLALTVYNNALGIPGIEDVVTPADLDRLGVLTKQILDGWNDMLCDAGAEHGFACVDVYHDFNGPDGTAAPGDALESDYAHPSQLGNDRIANLLAAVDVGAVTG